MTETIVTPGPHGRSRELADQDSEERRPKKRNEKDNAMDTDGATDAGSAASPGSGEHHDSMDKEENDDPNKKKNPQNSARINALHLIMQGNKHRHAMKKQSYASAAQKPTEKSEPADSGSTFTSCKIVHVTFT